MSERAALRVQLEAEQGRRKGLERAAAQRAAEAPMRIDMPAGEERPLRRGGGAGEGSTSRERVRSSRTTVGSRDGPSGMARITRLDPKLLRVCSVF